MVWLALVLIMVLVLVGYLCFAPIWLEVDTDQDLYRIRFHRLLSFWMEVPNGSPVVSLKILWWHVPLPSGISDKPKKKPPKKEANGLHNLSGRLVWQLLQSFKVRQCHVSIDTGDYVLNAVLYPWVCLLGRQWGHSLQINFWGEVTIKLRVSNSLARIGWIFIKHYIKPKT